MLTIKSSGDILEFWVDTDAPYGQVWESLEEKMRAMREFYRGSKSPAHFFGKKFTEMQKKEIRTFLQKEIGISVVSFSDDEDICDVKETEQQTETSKDLFFHGTLRSGQRLENEGNIVIVGDVNAGAEVVAGGNIVIFGKLRGLAHAGAQGRRDVLIAVNSLMPQQVRIGGKIAIIPRGREIEGPEIVRIEEDRIIVDSMG